MIAYIIRGVNIIHDPKIYVQIFHPSDYQNNISFKYLSPVSITNYAHIISKRIIVLCLHAYSIYAYTPTYTYGYMPIFLYAYFPIRLYAYTPRDLDK